MKDLLKYLLDNKILAFIFLEQSQEILGLVWVVSRKN